MNKCSLNVSKRKGNKIAFKLISDDQASGESSGARLARLLGAIK